MRIIAARDIVAPIRSQIANAYIDFSAMTASVLAIVTDKVVNGRPIVGFGFNSNGRYAPQGLFGGFADAVPVQDSRVAMPDIPGIGFEGKQALYAVMRPLEQG
jgi:hypothetical protein